VGLIDGIALTVGLQIGSGIFSSPGIVTLNTGSIGASLLVWLASGILAWTGASSFAELGAAIPLNGGAQAYLNYSFGPLSGYLFSWSAIVCLKPSSAAIMATIFGEYIARVLYHTTSKAAGNPHEQGLQGIPGWSIKLIAILIISLVTGLNALSARLGMRAQILLTFLKLGALVAVPVLAIIQAARGKMPDGSKTAFSSFSEMFAGSASNPSAYALALYSGLWAFDGWDQVSYVAGEMKNVTRDLPRVIHVSLAIVVAMFLSTVVSYFLVLPPNLVSQTNTVALDFGSAVLGTTGGILFALIVAFSCFGALNGQVYTTARFVYAAAREGHLPRIFGRINSRTRTPISALLLQYTLVCLFTLVGSGFASLVNFYGVCAWTFYLVTVLGLLFLRIKEPNLERPYRTWLSTPILFSAVALFLLCMPVFAAPGEALAAFAFISAGVPMYYATQSAARDSIARIPGLSSLVKGLRRMMGSEGDVDGLGRGGSDGAALFGRRRVRRLAKGANMPSHAAPGRLEDLQEDEEEGEEEEAVEMLPQRARDHDGTRHL
jgi:amino acid transporter